MNRKTNIYRFYIWDYLWWTGEKLHDHHRRITGEDMLLMYILFLLCYPLITLFALAGPPFVNRSFFISLLALPFVFILTWWIWNKKIYSAGRREAVMKHYAEVNFNPTKGFFLFFMPVIFFLAANTTICLLM